MHPIQKGEAANTASPPPHEKFTIIDIKILNTFVEDLRHDGLCTSKQTNCPGHSPYRPIMGTMKGTQNAIINQ